MNSLWERWAFFTDLDGTLLDHATFKWHEARPAIDAMRGARVPLIVVTSKTRAEVMALLHGLKLLAPFVVENGGAIYVPHDYFPFRIPGAEPAGKGWLRIARGVPRSRLVRELTQSARRARATVRTFSDMRLRETADRTGLSSPLARRARQREFDEPFVLINPQSNTAAKLQKEITRRGLQMTRGSRFFHVLGRSDKGLAVRQVVEWFNRATGGHVQTVGLGDSPNDIPLLRAVTIPIVVARPNGRYDPEVLDALPHVRRAGGVGPAGWNRAVLQRLRGS